MSDPPSWAADRSMAHRVPTSFVGMSFGAARRPGGQRGIRRQEGMRQRTRRILQAQTRDRANAIGGQH